MSMTIIICLVSFANNLQFCQTHLIQAAVNLPTNFTPQIISLHNMFCSVSLSSVSQSNLSCPGLSPLLCIKFSSSHIEVLDIQGIIKRVGELIPNGYSACSVPAILG